MGKPRDLLVHNRAQIVLSPAQLGVRATASLRALIQSGDLPSGTHLVEHDLAHLLGISRSPVREALRNLVRENLVVLSPNRGAMVAEWHTQDIRDLFAVRRPLEIEAMELATERSAHACAHDLADVLGQWRTTAEAADHKRCADFDLAFHRVIWEHASNRFLFSALEQTLYPLQTIFYLSATRLDDLVEMVDLHAQLREAIVTCDAAVARAAMAAHMAFSYERERNLHACAAPHDEAARCVASLPKGVF